MNFEEELTNLINKHSMENGSDTPDWILASYIEDCLQNFNRTVRRRDEFHGLKPWPKVDFPSLRVPKEENATDVGYQGI